MFTETQKKIGPNNIQNCYVGHPTAAIAVVSPSTLLNKLKSFVKCVEITFYIQIFQDEGMSNYIVVYLRLLTSAQLQKKEDFFKNFLEGGQTMKDFCSQVNYAFLTNFWFANNWFSHFLLCNTICLVCCAVNLRV